jgi:hypothetical protein
MQHGSALIVVILLTSCIIACRKAEEHTVVPAGTVDTPDKKCKKWILQSVVRSLEHGNFNNLILDTKDSVSLVRTDGRISSLIFNNSVRSGNGSWSKYSGKTAFTFLSNKICISYGDNTFPVDTLTVDLSMHILRRTSYVGGAGCSTPTYTVTDYEYGNNGLPIRAVMQRYQEASALTTYTTDYKFLNGDRIPDPSTNGTPTYDVSKLVPTDFISYEQLQNAGAFVYQNAHILTGEFDKANNDEITYSYKFDSTGRIIQIVSLDHYGEYGLRATDDYHYMCIE